MDRHAKMQNEWFRYTGKAFYNAAITLESPGIRDFICKLESRRNGTTFGYIKKIQSGFIGTDAEYRKNGLNKARAEYWRGCEKLCTPDWADAFTVEEVVVARNKLILHLSTSLKTIEEIAEAACCDRETVVGQLRAQGFSVRGGEFTFGRVEKIGISTEQVREMYRSGLTPVQIAKKLGCHTNSVLYHISSLKPRLSWSLSNKQISMLQDMAGNATAQEAAEKFGITVKTVNKWWDRPKISTQLLED